MLKSNSRGISLVIGCLQSASDSPYDLILYLTEKAAYFLMAHLIPPLTGNLFLDHLPTQIRLMILSRADRIHLAQGHVICDNHEVADRVLFPLASILSVVVNLVDGNTAEVGIVGREGMTGVGLVLGVPSSPQRMVVQVPDSAYALPSTEFMEIFEAESALRKFALRYVQATIVMGSYLSACNTLHPIHERCARWLLTAQDRTGTANIALTQEYLGQMLGVRRPGVTLAASALQAAGFIEYSRGHILVKNRSGLEEAACECYQHQSDSLQSIMGYSVRYTSSRP